MCVSKYVNKKGLQQKVKGIIKEICIWETKKTFFLKTLESFVVLKCIRNMHKKSHVIEFIFDLVP